MGQRGYPESFPELWSCCTRAQRRRLVLILAMTAVLALEAALLAAALLALAVTAVAVLFSA